MARAGDFFVPPRPARQGSRIHHSLAVEVVVAGRPDAESRGQDRRERACRCRRARREVGPVPVQRRGERSRPGQVGDRLPEIPVAPAERAQPGPVVVLDGRLGDVGELEKQLVPRHLLLPQGRRGLRVRHRDHGERPDSVWAQHGREPRHRRAPVMADDVHSIQAEPVQYRGHVGHHVRQPVRGHVSGTLRAPEPPQIRRDDPEPVGHQERDLMAPEPGGIRPAVQEQDRDAVAMILDVQTDPV
jgi:hypothetical protein